MILHPFHHFVNYSHTTLIILKIVFPPDIYSRAYIHHIATKLYFKQFKTGERGSKYFSLHFPSGTFKYYHLQGKKRKGKQAQNKEKRKGRNEIKTPKYKIKKDRILYDSKIPSFQYNGFKSKLGQFLPPQELHFLNLISFHLVFITSRCRNKLF